MSSRKRVSRKRRNRHPSHQQHARQADVKHPGDTLQSVSADSATAPPETPVDDASAGNSQAAAIPASPVHADSEAGELGQRFQQTREGLGLSLEEAAQQMRLPWRLVQKLEKGDWSGIDSPIYLRGYLKSYISLLGMQSPQLIDEVSQKAGTPQQLISTGGISRGRYILQRYAVAGTYLVITALIVVPVVVLGINGGLKPSLARMAPLDPVPASYSSANGEQTQALPLQTGRAGSALQQSSIDNSTLMASMAPVNLIDRDSNKPVATINKASQPATPNRSGTADNAVAGHGLAIKLDAPSWVEVTDATGNRLEYALLTSGEHDYPSDKPLNVRLGNAGAAKVLLNGKKLDLTPYKRSNVAYFQVYDQGTLAKTPGA